MHVLLIVVIHGLSLKAFYVTFTAKIKVYIYIYILPFPPPSIRHCKNMLGVLLQKDASLAITTTLCVVYIGRGGRPQ